MYLPTTTRPSVCHSPITKQRGLFCLLVCRGTLFLLWCGCLLSPYLSWHAPCGSSSVLPILVVCQPNRTLPPKELLSPPPNRALLPLTHDLTASCIDWVQAGEVWALRVPSFYICPKSACCSRVHHGLEACPHNLLFVL